MQDINCSEPLYKISEIFFTLQRYSNLYCSSPSIQLKSQKIKKIFIKQLKLPFLTGCGVMMNQNSASLQTNKQI